MATLAEAAFRLHQLQGELPSAAKAGGLAALRAALASPSHADACTRASDLNNFLVTSFAIAASDRTLCTAGVQSGGSQEVRSIIEARRLPRVSAHFCPIARSDLQQQS